MDDLALHRHLIGQQGGRASLNTPALLVDRDALARNIARMAAFAAAHNLALRPHAKTHKCAAIAKLQIEAGAVGICCAKLGEAEAMADAGIESILITSPVVAAPGIARLVALNRRVRDLRLVIDNPENAAALARAFADDKQILNVLIDVDPGLKRTGAPSAQAAVALYKAIQESPALSYLGVQFYCGREQHVASFEERAGFVSKRMAHLRGVLDALAAAGAPAGTVTGGGTGTHAIDADLGVLTELQAGSYVFMDRQYLDCELSGHGQVPFETALLIDARVISANTPGMATLDAGFKALATDGPAPAFFAGAPEGADFFFMGDEHGAVRAAGAAFRIGDVVTLTAPHCDPTINLYDYLHVIRGDTLIDIWPISARGRSR
jgi:D-serine deaminase-like pyridoxal phosphate-dependent protein